MKWNNKKILLNLGVIVIATPPLIYIVSCGNSAVGRANIPDAPNNTVLNAKNFAQYSKYDAQNNSLTIAKNVIGIDSDTFTEYANDGIKIRHLYLPNTLLGIGASAFSTFKIKTLELGNSLQKIEKSVFASSTLTSLTLPNSITTIGASAFSSSTLTSLTLPNNITTIGDSAFEHSTLTSLTIPNGVTSIGDYAFSLSSLTSLTIPNGVASIGEEAFSSSLLASLTFKGSPTTTKLVLSSDAFENTKISAITGGTGDGSWQNWATTRYYRAFKDE